VNRIIQSAAVLAFAALPLASIAQEAYPTRPVKIVVPYPQGGASDVTARLLAQKLTVAWGQSVVIENKPGATGIIGTETVAKSPADGYVLGLVASSQAINVVTRKKLPYDTLNDFSYISETATVPLVLVAAPNIPAKTASELVSMAKKFPDKFNYGSSGPGGAPHLTAELFLSQTGVKMTHVPYKGSSQAHPDLFSGEVNVMFDTIVAVLPHIRSGKLKALGTTTLKRSSLLPDVPTINEAVVKGFESGSWGALIGPANIPQHIVNKIAADSATALKSPEVREKLAQMGAEVVASTPEQMKAKMNTEIQKWGDVVRAAGIQPE
jgi:tripartite-type tricarboxylate transporter receptor subunit TctC